MPSQNVIDYCNKVREIVRQKHLIGLPTCGAVEVHIKEFEPEPLYIAVKNSTVSVEPYEYLDRDATLFCDLQTINDIFNKQISITEALQKKRIIVDGDAEVLYCLQRNV
jgi:putative sterol carrier protein